MTVLKASLLGLCMWAWCSGAAYAQEPGILTGRVVDAETEDPLPGATVLLAGTDRGDAAGLEGAFTFEDVAPGAYTLRVSFVGYRSREPEVTVAAGETAEVVVALAPDVFRTEEVVVTGQGVGLERQRLSTVTQVVEGEALETVPTPRLETLLQTQLPSTQFSLRSGQPGATSVIRSRGVKSVSQSTTPVLYVDGVRVDNLNSQAALGLNLSGNASQGTQTSAIADIPVENVERVEVLKGGAATTLYGSDAANGVIQIFTKQGRAADARLAFEAGLGAVVGTDDFFFFDRTDDLFYEPGLVQQYSLSASGGGSTWGYSFAGRIEDSEGFRIDNSQQTQYSLRSGVNADLSPVLRYRGTLAYANASYARVRDGNAGFYTPLWFAESARYFFFDAFASFDPGTDLSRRNLDNLTGEEFALVEAFVEEAEALMDNRIEVNRFQTSQAFEFEPLPDLTIRATGGIDFRDSQEEAVVTNAYLIATEAVAAGTSDRGSIDQYNRRFLGLTLDATAQHRAALGAFSFVSTLGTQFFREEDEQELVSGEGVWDGAEITSQAGVRTSDQVERIVANYGVYALQNIGLRNRYFLELGLRADGNSAFGDDVGFVYYPKVGLSYVLSSEPFYRGRTLAGVLSTVRLRANYGVAGNFPTPFANDRTVEIVPYLGAAAAIPDQPGNDDLEPEKTYTLEAGADLGFLDDRVTLGLTYYDATTRDALFLVPAAPSASESPFDPENQQLQNVGEIVNRGLEVETSVLALNRSGLRLRLDASLNTLHNEVTDAGGTAPFSIGGFSARTVQNVVAEGQPVGFIRGSRAVLNPDGTLREVQELQDLGSMLPDVFGSFSLALDAGRFNLFASADYQFGAQAHSFDQQFRFLYGVDAGDVPATAFDPTNLGNEWLNFTNFFVQDTDYVKVRLIALNYRLPERLYQGLAREIRLGFSVTNPFNWSASAFDPEATGSGAQSQDAVESVGVAYAIDPAPRTYLGTVRVSF